MPHENKLFTHRELVTLGDDVLVGEIDRALAGGGHPWRLALAQYYRDELTRRENTRTAKRMLSLTATVTVMTFAILVLTILNVIVVART